MTKSELIAALAEYPDDMRVFLADWQEQYKSPTLCKKVSKLRREWTDEGYRTDESRQSDEDVIVLDADYD